MVGETLDTLASVLDPLAGCARRMPANVAIGCPEIGLCLRSEDKAISDLRLQASSWNRGKLKSDTTAKQFMVVIESNRSTIRQTRMSGVHVAAALNAVMKSTVTSSTRLT